MCIADCGWQDCLPDVLLTLLRQVAVCLQGAEYVPLLRKSFDLYTALEQEAKQVDDVLYTETESDE